MRLGIRLLFAFFLINGMHRTEVDTRDHFPLGDPDWQGPLLTVS